jgi:membrane fusion protein, multidrug efflux system
MTDPKKHFLKKVPYSKKRVWVTAVVFVVVALAAGLRFYFYWQDHVATDDAFIESHVVQISPKVPAHILKVLVDDNAEVEEGALLVEQDDRDYVNNFLMAEAKMKAAEAERDQAAEDLERYKKLHTDDELSKQELDKGHLRLETAEAQVKITKAAKEQAELQLSYTKITSPVKGRVTRKTSEVGMYLQTGQALMAIVPAERWVVANFKETELTNMQPGQKAFIRVDTYPGKVYKGHVDSIQRGTGAKFSLLPAENATGNFIKVVQRVPVKIVFDENLDKNHPLVPGMSVLVTVKTS